jgi:predicted ABC-type ATPase
LIQRDELKDPSLEASYRASELAQALRDEYLRSHRSFVVETVFSHVSKLERVRAARANGFVIMMYHIGVNSPDLSVARVKERVGEGGHDVPEHKIRGGLIVTDRSSVRPSCWPTGPL